MDVSCPFQIQINSRLWGTEISEAAQRKQARHTHKRNFAQLSDLREFLDLRTKREDPRKPGGLSDLRVRAEVRESKAMRVHETILGGKAPHRNQGNLQRFLLEY